MGTTSPEIPNNTFVHELIDNSLKYNEQLFTLTFATINSMRHKNH